MTGKNNGRAGSDPNAPHTTTPTVYYSTEAAESEPDLKAAALAYAERGFKVFPLFPGKKKPLTENGFKAATGDADQIREWWTSNPRANIGLATEGLLVLDVDDPDTDFLTDEKLQSLAACPMQRTPSGGSHYVFRQPEGADVHCFANPKTKCDIRTVGGYIVAPPSTLPNGRYRWDRKPQRVADLPDPPGWLVEYASKKTTSGDSAPMVGVQADVKDADWKTALGCLPSIDPDDRDTWRNVGFALNSIRQDGVGLRAWVTWSQGSEKYRAGECEKVWAAMDPNRKDGIGLGTLIKLAAPVKAGPQPIKLLPWRPFPKVFPDRLWRYTVAKAAELEVDPAAVAVHILPAMSGAIGIGREIRLGTIDSGVGHWEPPIIWALLVGRTGRTKSPAQDAAVWPLWGINRDLKDAYTDEMEGYEKDLEDYNSRKKKTKPDPGEPPNDGKKPTEPKRKYLVIGDMTKERIVTAAEHSPRGFIQVSDEAGTFLSPRGGSDKKGEERAFACCCFGARPYLQGRVTRDGSDLERLGVSLSGCVPPATLKSYIDLSDWRSGFVARFVMVNPPKVEKRGEKKHTHPLLLQEYENLIRGLYSMPVEYDERERIIPHRHYLSPEAALRWREFEIEQDGRVMDAEAADREELEGVLSKLTGYAARFALVLHLARAQCGERVNPDVVDLESLNRGIRLAEFFAYESERLLPELRGGTSGADTTVIDWIGARGGECTANELAHGMRRFRNDPDGAEEFLIGLVRQGMGTWVNIPPGPSGGPGKRLFRLFSGVTVTTTHKSFENNGVPVTVTPSAHKKTVVIDGEEWEVSE